MKPLRPLERILLDDGEAEKRAAVAKAKAEKRPLRLKPWKRRNAMMRSGLGFVSQ